MKSVPMHQVDIAPILNAKWFALQRQRIDVMLTVLLAEIAGCTPAPLREAMAQPLLGEGKRLRPLLTLAAFAHSTTQPITNDIVRVACVFELMHAASLIYDDLPCMDDALERRGQSAVHIAYGEATALLAAIGLMNASYGIVARSESLAPAARVELMVLLADTVGAEGLAAGQYYDLTMDRSGNAMEMRRLKTGILFQAAAVAGAICAETGTLERAAVSVYADRLGTAFQLLDDLADHDVPATGLSLRRDMQAMLKEAAAALGVARQGDPLRAFIQLVFAGSLIVEPV